MKYIITAATPYGEPCGVTNEPEYDPENAVIKWCRYSEKYPTCASIQPATEEDGMALLKWTERNFERIEVYMEQHKCPYKPDWIKEQVSLQVKKGKTSMQWEYDQLFPFCMG